MRADIGMADVDGSTDAGAAGAEVSALRGTALRLVARSTNSTARLARL